MVSTFAFERFLAENGIRDAYLHLTSEIEAILANQEISEKDKRMMIANTSERIRGLIRGGRLDSAMGVGWEITEAVDACGLREQFRERALFRSPRKTRRKRHLPERRRDVSVRQPRRELLDWIKEVWSVVLADTAEFSTRATALSGKGADRAGHRSAADVRFAGVWRDFYDGVRVSGRDVIVIEAGYGLGEGVVSGAVDVDRYYVDKSRRVGFKRSRRQQGVHGQAACLWQGDIHRSGTNQQSA